MADLVRDLIVSKQAYHTREIARLDEKQGELEEDLTNVLAAKSEHSVAWGIYEEFLATYRKRK